MDSSIKFGKLWGIPLTVHLTWFLVFGLVIWSLAGGFFPQESPGLPIGVVIAMSLITSVLFFSSVLLHELGHAWVALRNHVPVKEITLFIFGGIAQIEDEPPSAGAEFFVASAGPAVSLILAGIFGLVWLLGRNVLYLDAPASWLMRVNFLLAAFNLIPGYPLDGGRLLRALVWKLTDDKYKATKVATASGQLVAFGFIGFGVFELIKGYFFDGLWLAFIGWFLQNAASASQAQSTLQHSLKNVSVHQVMQRNFPRVPGLLSVRQLVDEHVLDGGQRYFFVDEEGCLQGMVTLQNISSVPQRKWPFVTVSQVMVPLSKLVSVTSNLELMTALRTMDEANVARVPVIERSEVVGILAREDILHYIRTRAELGL
jgi:Zn-dependent protease/CBS domain-containing protein